MNPHAQAISKGWVALDIDGTITLDKYSVPTGVSSYLCSLQQKGWGIAIATGRPFSFAVRALSRFDFPYYFLVQNGSALLEMPGQKILWKRYLNQTSLPWIEQAYEGFDSDYLVYSGVERGDFCYWRPPRFSVADRLYLEELQGRQEARWEAVSQFTVASFPMVRGFGPPLRLRALVERLKDKGVFQMSLIRDPFDRKVFLLLLTHKNVSKGTTLKELFRLYGRGEKVVAAGDDENDISLLKAADIKIAMPHAPESVRKVADFLAPPVQEEGIVQALQVALGEKG